MTARKAFSTVGLALAVAFVTMSAPRPAMAQNSTVRLLEQIVKQLNSFGDVSHSWSRLLPAGERFVVLADFDNQAVLDRNTGLVWEKSPNPATFSWTTARIACMNSVLRFKDGGWRLPSMPELMSLFDRRNSQPALPTGHPFEIGPNDHFWSATTFADSTGQFAWDARVQDGAAGAHDKTLTNWAKAWCVRGSMNADSY